MKKFLVASCLALTSLSVFAADNSTETKNSFSCMDKQTFEVDAQCFSTTIEKSDSFVANQKAFYKDASEPGEYVMATLLMDPKTLNITVIAHREQENKTLARLDTVKK
ncbi:hypothetical protein [Glaciecola sp. 1036]|uniref:hypothetical protein n=1 Tax=Alteromonadaceae TaxID=72275 RepID=UPI003D036064